MSRFRSTRSRAKAVQRTKSASRLRREKLQWARRQRLRVLKYRRQFSA
ncbi:hypothetical protein [Biformimicrobium ophioploci]|nr:hypothetical protein [Microbulbifer sp. NKW57]